jgi:membrane-associated phospholipid phosphatase
MDLNRNPGSCSPVCDPSGVNGWDRTVIDHHNENAATASDVLVAVLPAQAIWLVLGDFLHLGGDDGMADILIMTEVLTVSGAVNQVVKMGVARPRPYMYREDDGSGLRKNNADDYRSFYSMHTSTVFSVLTGAAFIFSKRYPDSRLRWLVWTFALSGGATVAALRVGAGKHFYTDVITGAAAGCAVGLIVPAVHLRRQKKKDAVAVYPSGLGVAGTF